MADSNSLRIRGQETTVLLVVNGTPQAGSFAKIASGRWSTRADITNTGFLGEGEDEPDIQVHGYDVNFTFHEQDNGIVDNVWLPIVQAATSSSPQVGGASGPLPTIDIVFVKKYRDPKLPPVTLTFSQCKLKIDQQEFSDRKSYVLNTCSASCRKMKSV